MISWLVWVADTSKRNFDFVMILSLCDVRLMTDHLSANKAIKRTKSTCNWE